MMRFNSQYRLRLPIKLAGYWHLQTLCSIFLRHLPHLLSLPWHPLTFLHFLLLWVSTLQPQMISEKCREHWRHFQTRLSSYSWRCNNGVRTHDVAHQTTYIVSEARLLTVCEAAAITIHQKGITTEILPMTDTPLVMATDLQGMGETGTTEGIPTLVLDLLSAMHGATAHHPETTHSVVALLTAVRTDIPLTALKVLDMYGSIHLLTLDRTR